MGDDDMTAIFGALSVVMTAGIMIEFWYVWFHGLRKTEKRADAVMMEVLTTHGRESWDRMMRNLSGNYLGAVEDNALVDLLVVKYRDKSIQDVEKAERVRGTGTYDPRASDVVNGERLTQFYISTGASTTDQQARHQQEWLRADYNAHTRLLQDLERSRAVQSERDRDR